MVTEFKVVMTVKVNDQHGYRTTTDEVLKATRRSLDADGCGDVITLVAITVSRLRGICDECGCKIFSTDKIQSRDQAGCLRCTICG